MAKRKNSRAKGKRGELELSKELTRIFGTQCRRGQQFCGANGDADVVGLPGIHVECKRTETLNLYKALQQATDDAKQGDIPVVFHKKNRGCWVVICDLEDLVALAKVVSKHTENAAKDLPLTGISYTRTWKPNGHIEGKGGFGC